MRTFVLFLALAVLLGSAAAGSLGQNHCSWGPSHWCSTLEVAKDCDMVDYCKQKGHFKDQKRSLGSNPCTWGPSHWCANKTNANDCDKLEYCQKKGLLTN